MGEPLNLELLQTLSEAFGPSGCESEVRAILSAWVKPFCDAMETDALGNLLVYYGKSADSAAPSRVKLMLSAHMDEVGIMVTAATEEGLLRVDEVGGIDARVLCGKRVRLLMPDGMRDGVILEKPIHLQEKEERETVCEIPDLYLDVGAKTEKEALSLAPIGTFGTFDSRMLFLGDTKIACKALDDRAGCAILCEVLQALHQSGKRPDFQICFAFTVREEVGLSGAKVAANRLKPEYAVILETTAVADLHGVPSEKKVAVQGEGGVLSLADRSTVYPEAWVHFLMDTAKARDIPCQYKRYVSGGNDAAHIQRSQNGVQVAALSAPSRYLHSAANVLDHRDLTAMRDLVLALIAALPDYDTAKDSKHQEE